MAPRIRSSSQAGRPRSGVPKRDWPLYRKPMFALRSVKTTIKKDIADGVSQPEFKRTFKTPGLLTVRTSARQRFQTPRVPPASGANVTRIRTPRVGGGVVRVFGKLKRT